MLGDWARRQKASLLYKPRTDILSPWIRQGYFSPALRKSSHQVAMGTLPETEWPQSHTFSRTPGLLVVWLHHLALTTTGTRFQSTNYSSKSVRNIKLFLKYMWALPAAQSFPFLMPLNPVTLLSVFLYHNVHVTHCMAVFKRWESPPPWDTYMHVKYLPELNLKLTAYPTLSKPGRQWGNDRSCTHKNPGAFPHDSARCDFTDGTHPEITRKSSQEIYEGWPCDSLLVTIL